MNDFSYPWCNTCKNSFPMRTDTYHDLEKCGNTFYCPQGHRLFVSQARIVDQRDSIQRSADYRSETINAMWKREEGLRGVKTRQRNRLLRGACPYCGKTPKDLVKHIKDKHGPKVK